MKKDGVSATQHHRDAECVGFGQTWRTRPRTLWRRYGGSIVLILTLALLGCGGGDDEDLTGTWTGTVQDSLAGPGTILFTLSQDDARLNGTWQLTLADTRGNNRGTLSGTVSDDSITMVLSSNPSPECSFTVAAERDDDDHFTGTYAASSRCTLPQSGSLDVRRQ